MILGLLVAMMSFSFAQSNACSICDQMDALTAEFAKFDPSNSRDFDVASEKSGEALDFSPKVDAISVNDKKFEPAMRSFIRLMAAQLPYDMGTEGAELVVTYMETKGIKALYETTLAGLSDSCQREFMAYYVELRVCGSKRNCKPDHTGAPSYKECRARTPAAAKKK